MDKFNTLSEQNIRSCLQEIDIPYLNKGLLDYVNSIKLENETIELDVLLPFPAKNYQVILEQQVRQKLIALSPQKIITNINWQIKAAQNRALKGLEQVKNIIAVGSGKGGVGKSTVAVNLALALKQQGANVGLLDADIYGPNQPHLLGISPQKPKTIEGKMQPLEAHGIQTMSIGYLVDSNNPMIWRGPMASSALQQLIYQTQWHNLDYLVIDLPPGTGDIQLTLAQKIPVNGVVMVTTPQQIALLDVRKAIAMFQKVQVPILGIVENMSRYICHHCGTQNHIFGENGGVELSNTYQLELLGQLPLDHRVCAQSDLGNPILLSHPDSTLAEMYDMIALNVAAKLCTQPQHRQSKFPKIVVSTES